MPLPEFDDNDDYAGYVTEERAELARCASSNHGRENRLYADQQFR